MLSICSVNPDNSVGFVRGPPLQYVTRFLVRGRRHKMNSFEMVWDSLVDLLANGLLGLNTWEVVAVTLVFTHITIAAVTIFLHRAQAHRALDLHGIPSHFFRLWLWLTTGMVTKEWVAIHRKHHAKCETVDDPHSPQTRGIKTVLLRQRAVPCRIEGPGNARQVRPQHAG
jgi:fatty-acid desaturase